MKKLIYRVLKMLRDLLNYLFITPKLILRNNTASITCKIQKGLFISHSNIGKHTYIGRNNIINYTDIGNYCSIASDVQIGGMEHSHWAYSTSTKLSSECKSDCRTKIGNDVWIAAGVIIKQGVTIGDGAVIGANSFVTKDIAPYSISFGTPAKHFKFRFDEETRKKLIESKYWEQKPKIAKQILAKLK